MHYFLQSVAISLGDTCEGVEIPRFQALLRNLKDGTFHHSSHLAPLPAEAYMQDIHPGSTVGSTVPSSVRTASSATASQGTGVSSMTGASGTTAGGATPRTVVAMVDNPTEDTEFCCSLFPEALAASSVPTGLHPMMQATSSVLPGGASEVASPPAAAASHTCPLRRRQSARNS